MLDFPTFSHNVTNVLFFQTTVAVQRRLPIGELRFVTTAGRQADIREPPPSERRPQSDAVLADAFDVERNERRHGRRQRSDARRIAAVAVQPVLAMFHEVLGGL